MKLSEHYTETCINTGFFPGCIPENFVFGNALKVDVSAGNLVTDGHFMTDDQLTDYKFEQMKNALASGGYEYQGNAVNGDTGSLSAGTDGAPIGLPAEQKTEAGFFEKLGNLFTEGHFAGDEQVEHYDKIDAFEDKMDGGKNLTSVEKLQYYEARMMVGDELNDREYEDLVNTADQKSYWEKQVKDMGYNFDDDEVHIVGIRNNDGKYGTNKANDIFLVISDGQVQGVFAGSTEPGQSGHATLQEGQYDNFGRHPGWGTYHNDTLRVPGRTGGNPVYVDKNPENGTLDSQELSNPKPDNSIRFHFGGDMNKLIGNWSHGCQVITGNNYIDQYGSVQTYDNFGGWSAPSGQQGAYDDFANTWRKGDSQLKNIRYTLINDRNVERGYMYDHYRNLLYGNR